MVISGNPKVARMTESGRGMGVEVTERDHDENRERDEGRDQPCRPITTRQRLNLHQRCRTRGVSSPRASTYTPSHTSPYSPVPDKSLHINQIPTQHALPHVQRKVRGGGRGATLPKTCGFRTRPVFLRHTRRAGSLPSKVSLREGTGSAPASGVAREMPLRPACYRSAPRLTHTCFRPGLIRFLDDNMRPTVSPKDVRREQEPRSG